MRIPHRQTDPSWSGKRSALKALAKSLGLSHRLHALSQRRRLVHFVLRHDAVGLVRRRRLIAGWRIGQADSRRLAGESPVFFLLGPIEVEPVAFLFAKL